MTVTTVTQDEVRQVPTWTGEGVRSPIPSQGAISNLWTLEGVPASFRDVTPGRLCRLQQMYPIPANTGDTKWT